MIKIIYEPQKDRAAAYDDGKFIGESTYSKSDKLWIIDYTFVEGNCGGQGIVTKLVAKLVDEARKGGIKIIHLYSFAKKLNQEKNMKMYGKSNKISIKILFFGWCIHKFGRNSSYNKS